MKNEAYGNIKDKLAALPKKPGVYLLKDNSGAILYIGKAKLLRNRVRSYFQDSLPPYIKTHLLTRKIKDLETIVTDTEKEALILEANLVKLYKPRYNVNLKDDKSYPYIKITNEDFPQVVVTRKKINDGGPCEGLVSRDDYNDMGNQVRDFFRGHTTKLAGILTVKMNEAAEKQRYETAALYRDRLREIENFQARQKVVDVNPVDRDIIAVAADDDIACGVVFMEREGKILGRRHHALDGVGCKSEEEILKSFIMQVYLNAEYVPPEIFISHAIEDRESIADWLTGERGGKVKILTPMKGDKAKLTEMCLNNAKLLLQELLLQRHQRKDFIAFSVKTLKEDLNLQIEPKTIEAFDISNFQGKDAVASMVSFFNGVPQKKEYRIFKIRSKDTPDDFTMIAEAVERRYSRLLAEQAKLPDLILIDGGKGQLSAALGSLQKLKIDTIPVAGLAKRLDEVFIPHVSVAQNILRTSSGLRLLQRIRDEAHRFALMHHRKQRKKRTLTSELDTIPGIGVNRRKSLLNYFGSVSRLRNASPRTIANVNNISMPLAQKIHNHLKASQDAQG